jgi:hypothetical protein
MGQGDAVQLLGEGRPRAQSLPVTTKNFMKPWFFVNVHRGRVARFFFAWKFVD